MSPTLKSTAGWVTLRPNLGVFPLEQTRHVGVAKSERTSLTNGEIVFEEFQSYVITIHQRHRRTDRETTCNRNTALCTKVHRAVKNAPCIWTCLRYSFFLSFSFLICSVSSVSFTFCVLACISCALCCLRTNSPALYNVRDVISDKQPDSLLLVIHCVVSCRSLSVSSSVGLLCGWC